MNKSPQHRAARTGLRPHWLAMAAAAALGPLTAPPTWAGAVSDGSWGRAPTSFSGHFTIPESLGKRAGDNLFQSFGSFSVAAGESATFTTTTPTLRNVIVRVSGLESTLIDGPLQLSAAGSATPSLYLVNPNGVTFGPGAAVSVPGAFHVSTAQELRFADGTVLPAGRGADNVFTVAAPESFGFLGGTAAAAIRFLPGSGIALSGDRGTLDVSAGAISVQGALLSADSATLRLVALGSERLQLPTDAAMPAPMAALGGTLELIDGAVVGTRSGHLLLQGGALQILGGSIVGSLSDDDPAGLIEVQARDTLHIADSFISSLVLGPAPAGAALHVVSGGTIDIEGDSGGVQASTFSTAPSGPVLVEGQTIRLQGQTAIAAFTGAEGAAGSVGVHASGALSVRGDSVIVSQAIADPAALSRNVGSGGRVEVTADSVLLDAGGSGVASISSQSNYVGVAADVTVTVRGTLSILNGARISSSAFANPMLPPDPLQHAGNVTVSASSIVISGAAGDAARSGIFSDSLGLADSAAPGPGGDAGRVNVTAREITMSGRTGISADTSGPGAAGQITVTADRLTMHGDAQSDASISTTTTGSGTGGTIQLRVADTLALTGNANVQSASIGTGAGGSVIIDAGQVRFDGAGLAPATGVLASALGSGRAGDVQLRAAQRLTLVNGGVVTASTSAEGAAGKVSIEAGALDIDGQGVAFTGIRSVASPESGGLVGAVAVTVHGDAVFTDAPEAVTIQNASVAPGLEALAPSSLSLSAGRLSLHGSSVLASSTGTAPGSTLQLAVAGEMTLRSGSRIRTSSQDGDGGSIDVAAARYLWLDDAQLESSVLGTRNGNGGNIHVQSPVLVMANGSVQANTTAPLASGGDVGIDVAALVPSAGVLVVGGSEVQVFDPAASGPNVIQAAAPDGISGNVQIGSPVLDIAGSLSALEAVIVDFGNLGRDLCRVGVGSSLSVVGRGGPAQSILDPLRLEP